jgi:hemerythrin-like domain-containing protein
MILVHNIIIRGINCVHRQAVRVATEATDQDKLDFANFAYQWSRALQQHHDLEETLLFPRMSEAAGDPALLDGPKEEHREFDAGLNKYEEYVKSVKEGKQELDGEKLKGIVDEVMPIIHRHLVHEIDTLLGLEKFGDEVDWIKILQEVAGASARQDMMQSWYRVSFALLVIVLLPSLSLPREVC